MTAAAPAATRSKRARAGMKPMQRPAWLPHSVWPFETAALELKEMTLAVTDVGDGPALLFVHTGLWSFVWRDVIARLAKDFRCIAFDAPGAGRSEPWHASAIGLAKAADATAQVIEALGLAELTLVFHDLGGPSGVSGAARTAKRIHGLVAVNTFAWTPAHPVLRAMLALMGNPLVREFDAATGMLARISSSSFGAGRHLDRDSRRAFRSGIGPRGLRTFHRYMYDARHADAIYREAEAALRGPFKSLPLLSIFGERNDPFGFQRTWKELFPRAQQVVVARGNHFPMCDDPELVANTIRTWRREHISGL